MRFETYEETLENYPETLLGSPTRRREYYSSAEGEYVFARDKPSFDAILFFYQSRGILAKPDTVSEETFLEEIEFYGLSSNYYSFSCDDLSSTHGEGEEILPLSPHKRKLWLWFEFPRSSQTARVLALWSIFVIVFSTVVFCIETIPDLAIEPRITYQNISKDGKYILEEQKKPTVDYWFVMEGVFVAVYSRVFCPPLFRANCLEFRQVRNGSARRFRHLPILRNVSISTEHRGSSFVRRVARHKTVSRFTCLQTVTI